MGFLGLRKPYGLECDNCSDPNFKWADGSMFVTDPTWGSFYYGLACVKTSASSPAEIMSATCYYPTEKAPDVFCQSSCEYGKDIQYYKAVSMCM